jgi:hypothetical protein
MGATAPLIARVETPEYGRVIINASDGKRYHADLSSFSRVYCYPKSREAWQAVGIDGWGLALVWTSRFEVHVDQILALADRVDVTLQSA